MIDQKDLIVITIKKMLMIMITVLTVVEGTENNTPSSTATLTQLLLCSSDLWGSAGMFLSGNTTESFLPLPKAHSRPVAISLHRGWTYAQ